MFVYGRGITQGEGRRMSLVTPLKRTAIIVRDMERSLAFWRDGLGLGVWVEGQAGRELPPLYRLLGLPPCTTRWVILQSGDVDWGMVGLFESRDPAPRSLRLPRPQSVQRGEACLVFHSPDVRRIHRVARKLGLQVLCPPTRLALKAHGVESLEMTLRDPDGVLVNLIQNVKGGALGLSNEFPGLRRPKPAKRKAVQAPVRRRIAVPARGRSG
jgi:catechol 2,3-dioxygenase-like lactoylglutathione lyase family enzyme